MRNDGFDEFVAGWSGRLLRAAYLLTGDRGLAEDLVQDVYERLYVAWPRVADPAAYAHRALTRQAMNRWRMRSRRPVEAVYGAEHDRPDQRADPLDALHERSVVVSALRTLTARQRAVVVLRFFADLSEADTAAAMGCSVGTVKSQTARALARLRTVLPAIDDTRVISEERS
ncbi:SigE family RNA polymerase sigma factor [Jiangella rhizosphaerae]|uniref:SigE family RNA polymerase sigma factor n=1 Tax=Jiangella rhizosphaerae TaxID=2293569 RepID=A0A418KWD0_9ACTN|nr:SigE family RNA polymerase sigma factor [Jiangella rhizosphaerae]RIQ35857.1 SigE family RNA polymerase sigma factor [Jiangella rhizosphaerae]